MPATAKGIHKILVVDDDPSIRQIMNDLLLLDGYEVTTAEDAESALQFMERGTVDMLITDLGLPSMDGWDLAAAARRCLPHIGILAISSWQGEDAPQKMAEYGIDLMVWKPFRFDQIRQAIDRMGELLSDRSPENR
jgi:DNA-binding response OmpR family regulator